MRNRFIVTYDISEDDRRNRVFALLRGRGDHLQYSVFRCDLSPAERVSLLADLHRLIDHGYDQILLFDLGPIDGRAATCIDSIGRRYLAPERTVFIL
ncbi:MAG: CRISPR-associated endonuclease Cas2 [Deltaproteobacteria bacterium]|nr:CRISPR-associated endonuclease Cas2 [Deltaproteobacteria bacterium]